MRDPEGGGYTLLLLLSFVLKKGFFFPVVKHFVVNYFV